MLLLSQAFGAVHLTMTACGSVSHLHATQSREEEMDPARVGHPLQRCLNVVEDLLSMQEAKPFASPVCTSTT